MNRAFLEAQNDEAFRKKGENSEEMSDKDQRNASSSIDVFELQLVSRANRIGHIILSLAVWIIQLVYVLPNVNL